MSTKPLIIIPSRLGSTRLPNKPIADICGKPMIWHVANRGLQTGYEVILAADNQKIINAVDDLNVTGYLTDEGLPSGTDRIHQAYQKSGENAEIIVNLQGDLPIIQPELITELVNFAKNSDYDIITAVSKIKDESETHNPNVVKAIISWDDDASTGKALYFTRATAPYGAGDLYHHIGIYIYKSSALKKFITLPESPLEKREKLEQLRALENNMTIGVLNTEHIPLGVDTQEDLEKVREIIGGES